MNRRTGLPDERLVQQASAALLHRCQQTVTRPSVLALARQFGLSNTISAVTTPRSHARSPSTVTPRTKTQPTSPAPRATTGSSNVTPDSGGPTDLTDLLRLAAAHIQRLTLHNDQLRHQLESANKITRIDSHRPRQSREHQST
jgi:hypothetical protein